MKKWLDRILTGFAIFFSIPTILILISWNAIPGGFLYPIKSSLEDIALAITVKTPIASVLSLEFTNRRFNEATVLLAKEGSSAGYNLVVAEAKQTESLVSVSQDVKKAEELINNIDQYQTKIEEQKKQIEVDIANTPAVSQPAHLTTPTPVPTPVATPTTSTSPTKTVVINQPVTIEIKQEKPEEVLTTLETTQQELEQVKERIKKNVPEVKKDQKHDTIREDGSTKDQENQKDKQDSNKNTDHMDSR